MKREAFTHTKMKRLCRRLDIPNWQGVGLLESIWNLAANQAPQGDIGKLSDEDIALAIDYRGDETRLIEALVLSGWLERSTLCRLAIHDWSDHAPDYLHSRLARSRLTFWNGEAPKLSRIPMADRDEAYLWVKSLSAQKAGLSAHERSAVNEHDDVGYKSAQEANLSAQTAAVSAQYLDDKSQNIGGYNQYISAQEVCLSAQIDTVSAYKRSKGQNGAVPIPIPKTSLLGSVNILNKKPDETVLISAAEFESAWERHHKHKSDEPLDLVFQVILSMNGTFDLVKFKERHPKYCLYWDSNGWNYCSLSFLAWIRAGMPLPPPVAHKPRASDILDNCD